MNNFKVGDIVLFSWKPIYDHCAPWRKGKIVAISNNVSLNNPANFVSKPEYYVSEVDDHNNIIDSRQLFAIDKDSEYILKFLPGMELMIGKNIYYTNNEHTVDIKNVSKDDYLEIPDLKEMVDDKQEWKEKIERKLDDINDKLNKLLLCQRTLPQETPSSPWYTNNKTYPWFDTSKVYCDNDSTNIHHVYKHIYASNIAPEET